MILQGSLHFNQEVQNKLDKVQARQIADIARGCQGRSTRPHLILTEGAVWTELIRPWLHLVSGQIEDSLLELIATVPEEVHEELLLQGHWWVQDATSVPQSSICQVVDDWAPTAVGEAGLCKHHHCTQIDLFGVFYLYYKNVKVYTAPQGDGHESIYQTNLS